MKNGVASVLAVFWAVASGFMIYKFGFGDNNWDHALIAYNAISSVGFAAIGVLLGVQVQQVDLTKARADAEKKTTAIKSAISHLAPAQNTAADGGGGAGTVGAARQVLLEAL